MRGLQVAVLAALLWSTAVHADSLAMVLSLPHEASFGAKAKFVWIEIEIGALARADQVLLMDDQGGILGVISPYGRMQSNSGGRYYIPVPKERLITGELALKIGIKNGAETRAPAAGEIRSIRLSARAEKH